MNEMIEKSSKGHKVGSSGASAAILFFFLPWVLASCGGQQIKLSGWKLAAGYTVNYGFSADRVSGKPILFLVLLAAISVLYIAYLALQRGHLTSLDGYGLIGLGAFALFILLTQFSGMKNEAAQQGVYVEYQLGLWVTVLGFIAVIVGGRMNLKEP